MMDVEKCFATSMAIAVLPTAVGPAIMIQVFCMIAGVCTEHQAILFWMNCYENKICISLE
jgi:hypothetical protein